MTPKKLYSIKEALSYFKEHSIPHQSLNEGMHIKIALPDYRTLNYYPTTGSFNLDGQPKYPLKGLPQLVSFLNTLGMNLPELYEINTNPIQERKIVL